MLTQRWIQNLPFAAGTWWEPQDRPALGVALPAYVTSVTLPAFQMGLRDKVLSMIATHPAPGRALEELLETFARSGLSEGISWIKSENYPTLLIMHNPTLRDRLSMLDLPGEAAPLEGQATASFEETLEGIEALASLGQIAA